MRQQGPRDRARGVFENSIEGLATVGAVAAAFLTTPLAYGHSLPLIQEFTAKHYGAGFGDLVALGWFVIVALMTFFAARASLATALTMGGLALAARMF